MDESIHKKNFKSINIRDLFMDKNPSLARWIPGFVTLKTKFHRHAHERYYTACSPGSTPG